MREKLVVVGNGMAGMRTVDELLQAAPDRYDITVFGDEPHGNYDRIMLTPLLYGAKSVDDIMIHDLDWYSAHHITLHCGADKKVVHIDRGRRLVIAADGTRAGYDRLLLATGSRPFMVPIEGSDVAGVMGFRDIADVTAMIEKAETRTQAVVLGGGLLGLEAADGLRRRGMSVTVVNRADRLLNLQLDEEAAALLRVELERRGVNFRLGTTVARVVPHDGHISEVVLDDGKRLRADVLIMATGVRPNKTLAEDAGLRCEKGIIVNDTMQTYDPRIYAVGECIEHRGDLFGMVAPVYEQARVCANHLAGHGAARYRKLTAATRLKVSGIDLFSAGDFLGREGSEVIVLRDRGQGIYKKWVVKDNRLSGVLLYGDTFDNAWYLQLLKDGADISGFRQRLPFGAPQAA